ncbi:MAG: hypothetical protein WC627_12115, partial [Legionella sp.]
MPVERKGFAKWRDQKNYATFTAIKLCTTTRHPECNEGSPKVALDQFQEILHCVQDDVAVPRLRTAIKLCTT